MPGKRVAVELSVRAATLWTALCLVPVLSGCTEGADPSPGSRDDGGASSGPNFTFAVADGYADGTAPADFTVERLETFFGDALAPLQGLPGLLPRTVSVVYEPCGQPNAFHDRASDSIRICTELAGYARDLFELLEPPFPDDPDANAAALDGYVLSAMGFVLHHEIAHALDFQRDLPLVGNVESAMDSIATVISVETGRFAFPLSSTTLFLREASSLTGRHGGGPDRVEDIECWTRGGEALARARRDAAPTASGPDAAGADCADAYARLRDAVRAWVPELARLTDGGTDPDAVAAPGRRSLRLVTGDAWLAGAGADAGVRRDVERLFSEAFGPLEAIVLGLTGSMDVVYDECGAAGSSHDPESRTITLCAELVEEAYELWVRVYRAGFGRYPNGSDRRILREDAYELLRFALYHEVGHAVRAAGRVPAGEDAETIADAVAAVLLVEAGRGPTVDSAAFFLSHWPEGGDGLDGDLARRESELRCLVLGGDANLRTAPTTDADLIDTYITGDRDCVGEYAARREEVRAWVAPRGSDS